MSNQLCERDGSYARRGSKETVFTMNKPLTLEQQVWVDNTLGHMTIEDCVGHLLMPEDRGYSAADWRGLLGDVPLGCVFMSDRDRATLLGNIDALQAHSRIPVVVAADMEAGVGGGTAFPYAMAFGAAGDPALLLAKARATAREARALGVHWVFQPVADILCQFQNPETSLRAFGDKPARVRALVAAQVRGLQEGGLLAATAKHFPGAGADDRDQHLCTSLNPFAMGKWRRTYGSVWRGAIDAGVMAVMTGHVALPDYEGLNDRPSAALPATLSLRVQSDLLRGELGFTGVIVSDAAPMVGMASRVRAEEQALQFILAGGDVYLFADPRRDFARLMQAVRDGRLTEARVRASARRVLELKARVGLFRSLRAAEVTAPEAAAHAELARQAAERSVTLWKNDGLLPVSLPAGARVLTVTVRWEHAPETRCPELTVVDEELRRRGFVVDHLLNPDHSVLLDAVGRYDLVCVNVVQMPHAPIGSSRMIGAMAMTWWRGFWAERRHVVFTAFGSPFVVYEAPQWPNAVLTYGACGACQCAAVKVWLGELDPRGVLPVKLPRF
jgi:beta-N-acetylhexosaminidase